MNTEHLHRLVRQYSSLPVQGPIVVPDTELSEIIDTFEDMIDWLKDLIGKAKEPLKDQAEKYKKKLQKLKEINGGYIPAGRK